MNDRIIVDYNFFTLKSKVWVIKDGEYFCLDCFSNLKDVVDSIIHQAYFNNIFTVQVRADERFTEKLSLSVKEAEKNLYASNKITLEEL